MPVKTEAVVPPKNEKVVSFENEKVIPVKTEKVMPVKTEKVMPVKTEKEVPVKTEKVKEPIPVQLNEPVQPSSSGMNIKRPNNFRACSQSKIIQFFFQALMITNLIKSTTLSNPPSRLSPSTTLWILKKLRLNANQTPKLMIKMRVSKPFKLI